jgi:hypothetical protein
MTKVTKFIDNYNSHDDCFLPGYGPPGHGVFSGGDEWG